MCKGVKKPIFVLSKENAYKCAVQHIEYSLLLKELWSEDVFQKKIVQYCFIDKYVKLVYDSYLHI